MTQTSEPTELADAPQSAEVDRTAASQHALPPLLYLRDLVEWLRDLPWLLQQRGRAVQLELLDGRPLSGTLSRANVSGLTLLPADSEAEVVVERDAIAEDSLEIEEEGEIEGETADPPAGDGAVTVADKTATMGAEAKETAAATIRTTITYRHPVLLDTGVRSNLVIAGALGVLAALVYTLSHQGEAAHLNYFVLLADAFNHGRLDLIDPPPWLNELVNYQGHKYVVYPPMPAILLMPAVALFGTDFPQPALSIFAASVSVGVAYLVVLKLFEKHSVAVWSALLLAFGTNQWYHAEVGSVWYTAEMVAPAFIWLALLACVTNRSLFLVGLCISAAYMSRLPTIGAAAFVVIYFWDKFVPSREPKDYLTLKVDIGPWLRLGWGLLIGLWLNGMYNFVRYGTFRDIGYDLLPIHDEPWYRYGLLSVKYVPTHLEEIFTRLPHFQDTWPFMVPNLFAMALWVTTPAWVLILFARFKSRVALGALAALVLISIPILTHGGNGFTQFGYRFALDFTPFMIILAASGMRGRVRPWVVALIVASIAINLWGVLSISVYDTWVLEM